MPKSEKKQQEKISGSFDEIIKASVSGNPTPKPKKKNTAKKQSTK